MTTVYLFDCDGTLYDDSKAHGHFTSLLLAYLGKKLNIEPHQVLLLREKLVRKYGIDDSITVFSEEYEIPRAEIYAQTFGRLDLTKCGAVRDLALREALLKLKGKRVIFTNNPKEHAAQVTLRLGVSECFDGIFGSAEIHPYRKPMIGAYRMVEEILTPFVKITFVEDTLANLLPAHEMGWRTVWLSKSGTTSEKAMHVNHSISSIYEVGEL